MYATEAARHPVRLARNQKRKASPQRRQRTYSRGAFEQDQLSSLRLLCAEIKKASTSTKHIPASSKIEEADAKGEDQTVEESPAGDSRDHKDFGIEDEEEELKFIPATEDELKGEAAAMDHETLVTADLQELEDIENLVAAKEDVAEFREEDLDILCDDPINQSMDDNAQDFEESLEFETSEDNIVCSIDEDALPLRKSRRKIQKRQHAKFLVQSGKYYDGTWCPGRQIVVLRIAPKIARIEIPLSAFRREDWPKKIFVKAFIHPGRCHPKRWAMHCNDNEPAARLAFRVSTEKETFFVRDPSPRAAYKANTFMDWVSDTPLETILLRPRRYINANVVDYVRPFGLPSGGTWMTDEKGQLQRAGVGSGWANNIQEAVPDREG